jgi:hypothetical protein
VIHAPPVSMTYRPQSGSRSDSQSWPPVGVSSTDRSVSDQGLEQFWPVVQPSFSKRSSVSLNVASSRPWSGRLYYPEKTAVRYDARLPPRQTAWSSNSSSASISRVTPVRRLVSAMLQRDEPVNANVCLYRIQLDRSWPGAPTPSVFMSSVPGPCYRRGLKRPRRWHGRGVASCARPPSGRRAK